jgi:hypothetical protein
MHSTLSVMSSSLRALFLAHPWVPVYGPVLLVTVLTYLFKVAARLIRDRRWTWLERSYFYFGMPLLWASFGRVLASFVSEISGGGDLDPYLEFLAGWAVCALFIFAIHASYELPEAELLEELRLVWQRDKQRAERMGREFVDPAPTHDTLVALQRTNLMCVASLIGLATFALFDYIFVGMLLT